MSRKRRERINVEPRRIKGRRNWYAQWTDIGTGKPHRVSTGVPVGGENPPPEAWDVCEQIAQRLESGPSETVADLMAARLRDAEGRVAPVTLRNMRQQHKNLVAVLGRLEPPDCDRQRIKRYIERDRAGRPTAAARELEELRSAFRLAGIDVPRDWPTPPRMPPRDRFLSHQEAARLLDVAQRRAYHVHLFCLIALSTGARKSAILALTWDRVDFDRGVIDFHEPGRAMTKKRRPVSSVDPRLATALRDAREIARSDHVIEHRGRAVADIKKGFAEAADEAGVPWCTPHHLKHTAISWLFEAGYSLDWISDFTETTPATCKRIYRKTNPDTYSPMTTALGDRVFGLSATRCKTTVSGDGG